MNLSTESNTAPLPHRGDVASRKGFGKEEKKISNRKMWWKKTVVRRSTSSIEPEFDHVTARSHFLQRHAGDDKSARGIALFHRSEIITGQVLGQGGFSSVVEVTRFQLSPEVSVRCTPEEQHVREQYAAITLNDATINSENVPHPRYCIKHLQERLIQSPKDFQCAASDLAVEAAFLSTLEHDNIVSVRGLPIDGIQAWGDGQHDGYFIIMDRLSHTLDKQIQDWQTSSVAIHPTTRVPTVMERTEMATQLASALQYLHSERIIFRDLKPANLGFDFEGKVKLFDFGLCRELPHREPSTPCGMYEMSGVGTRRYMAPEIINEARYNLKADVYGWAMVFWEMLSLTKPYAPYSTTDHRREVCERGERPEYLPHIPSGLQHLLQQAWDQNVERRLTMNEVLQHLRMALLVDKENNQELNMTNHANVHVQKDFAMPVSPTGVHDFFHGTATAMSTSKSLDAASIQQCPELFHEDDQNNVPVAAARRRGSKKKPVEYLNLPDAVVRTVSAVSTNKSLDSGSIEHYFHDQLFYEDSPPPLPKKPAAYLSIPDAVVNAIALSWSDDDVSDIDSLALDESIVEHMMNEVAL